MLGGAEFVCKLICTPSTRQAGGRCPLLLGLARYNISTPQAFVQRPVHIIIVNISIFRYNVEEDDHIGVHGDLRADVPTGSAWVLDPTLPTDAAPTVPSAPHYTL